MSSTLVPVASNTAAPVAAIAGDSASDQRSVTNQWSCASAAACRNTMRSSGTPAARRLVGTEQHGRALVDVDVGAHALRVREADGAVVGRDRADLLGRVRDPRPRVRIAGRDRGEARPHLAHVALVLVDAVAELRPQRGLEERIHHRRRDREVRHLVLARAGRVVADDERARRIVARLPLELDPRLAPRPPAGVHALGAADEHDVAVAPLYAQSRTRRSGAAGCCRRPSRPRSRGAMPSLRASNAPGSA